MKNKLFILACLGMALAIAASNFLVQFQINNWITWASFTYPLTFLVADISNRHLGMRSATRVVMLGFALGVILSFATSTPRIAIASGTAFLVAQLINLFIFDKLRNIKIWWRAPCSSSSISSVIDTFIFFGLSFAYTSVPWATLALGDLGIKLLMVVLLLPPYRFITYKFMVRLEAEH